MGGDIESSYVYDKANQLIRENNQELGKTWTWTYDPEIGRFLNADAFASTGQGFEGNNMFAYCLNNPACCADAGGSACYTFLGDDNIFSDSMLMDRGGGGGSVGVVTNSSRAASQKVIDYEVAFWKGETDWLQYASYNGKLVIYYNFTGELETTAFSFGVIVMDSYAPERFNYSPEETLKHEYGHALQMDLIGPIPYAVFVALPSLAGNILERVNLLPCDYYSLPWEHTADILGQVNRGGYEPWASGTAVIYWMGVNIASSVWDMMILR